MSTYRSVRRNSRGHRPGTTSRRHLARSCKRVIPLIGPILACLATLVVTMILMTALGAQPAAAQGMGDVPSEDQLGTITDSAGVPAENYRVPPIDRGNLVSPGKSATAWYVDTFWGSQVNSFNGALWLFQWLLSFTWVDAISSPFVGFATTIESVLGGLNFIPFALSLTALVYGVQMMRGRYGHSAINMITSAIVAVLIGGVLANPATAILGPNGLLHKGIDAGSQLAVAVATDGEEQTSTELGADDVINETVNQQLADIFLREPAMYVSFGKTLTGECEQVFNDAMMEVTPGNQSDDSVREAVMRCDEEAKFFVENPSGQADLLLGVGVTLFAFFIMAAIITLILLASVVILGFRTILLVPKGLLALLPGDSRAGFWHALLQVLAAVVYVALSLSALVFYLRFVIGLMTVMDPLGRNKFFLLTVAFIGGAVVMFVLRKKLLAASSKVSQRMSAAMGAGKNATPKPIDGRTLVSGARKSFHSVQSLRTASALSAQKQSGSRTSSTSRGGGGGGGGDSTPVRGRGPAPSSDAGDGDIPPPTTGSSDAPAPRSDDSDVSGRGAEQSPARKRLTQSAQVALGVLSKVPGAAPYAKAGQVAVAALPMIKDTLRKNTGPRYDGVQRTDRNDRVRRQLSAAEGWEMQRRDNESLMAAVSSPRSGGVRRQEPTAGPVPRPAERSTAAPGSGTPGGRSGGSGGDAARGPRSAGEKGALAGGMNPEARRQTVRPVPTRTAATSSGPSAPESRPRTAAPHTESSAVPAGGRTGGRTGGRPAPASSSKADILRQQLRQAGAETPVRPGPVGRRP